MWRKKLKNKSTNKCCPYWAVPSGGSATGLKLLTLCLGFCCSKGLIGTPVSTEKFKNCCNLCCYMEEKQQAPCLASACCLSTLWVLVQREPCTPLTLVLHCPVHCSSPVFASLQACSTKKGFQRDSLWLFGAEVLVSLGIRKEEWWGAPWPCCTGAAPTHPSLSRGITLLTRSL